MVYEIFFAPEAVDDLRQLFNYIADRSAPDRARAYIDRIWYACLSPSHFPERGTQREDLRPGLRIIGFERRATIAFHITTTSVVIDRIFHGGRDIEGPLR